MAKREFPTYRVLPDDMQEKYGRFFKQMNESSQNYQILLYILRWGEITPADAYFDRYIGSLRLGARIHNLKAMGVPIKTHRRTITSDRGATQTFAVYTIESEEQI